MGEGTVTLDTGELVRRIVRLESRIEKLERQMSSVDAVVAEQKMRRGA